MKLIYTLFYFLGSVYLAIILIATAALYVISGTLIEAKTGSHLHAAQYTYSHPLFSLLLAFFFINILFSALRRWPFQKKHVPFLITHLGLLMIIGGVLIKNGYGIQGVMEVLEGSTSHTLHIPHTHALRIEDKENRLFLFPKENVPQLKINVAGFAPHVTEKWVSYIKGDAAFIAGFPLIPVYRWSEGDLWPEGSSVKFPTDPNEWVVLVLRTNNPEAALRRAALDYDHKPLLIILEDEAKNTSLWAFHADDKVYFQSLKQEDLTTLVVYDGGFSGYGVQSNIPLSNNIEELRSIPPPIKLFKEACEKCGKAYEELLIQYLKNPLKAEQIMESIDWKSLSKSDIQGCFWTAHLLDQLSDVIDKGEDIRSYLEKNGWPLELPKSENNALALLEVVQQLYLSAPYLPSDEITLPDGIDQSASWLRAYLYAYGISSDTLLPPIVREKPNPSIVLETTLTLHHQSSTASQKLEENRPGVHLEVGKGNIKESVTLAFDPVGRGLRLPILNGEYMVRFQPEWKVIPYRIRLRQARQINYAHSQQPYSYESDVIINGEEVTLSMNKVYQTWDGYRFYMSGISVGADQLKRVQIVVNHDPVKYFLTYPGGGIVALGIILLFWGKKRTRPI